MGFRTGDSRGYVVLKHLDSPRLDAGKLVLIRDGRNGAEDIDYMHARHTRGHTKLVYLGWSVDHNCHEQSRVYTRESARKRTVHKGRKVRHESNLNRLPII